MQLRISHLRKTQRRAIVAAYFFSPEGQAGEGSRKLPTFRLSNETARGPAPAFGRFFLSCSAPLLFEKEGLGPLERRLTSSRGKQSTRPRQAFPPWMPGMLSILYIKLLISLLAEVLSH